MKHIIILLAWMSIINQAGQDIYTCKNAKLSLFSSAPVEDIAASTSAGISVFNAGTGELAFSVPIRSFRFDKALMQEHFNEEYMESDKYPQASFKGMIQEHVDITKDGTYPVIASGELEVHGVKKSRTIPGRILVSGGAVTMTSEFMVKCVDHHITIPSIVFHNIAESIRLRVSATYTALKK